MKAAFYTTYGTADNIHVTEVPVPVPKDNEVLVRVHAASLNSWDWEQLTGKPCLVRIGGIFTPRYKILGADISGTVVQVGKSVKLFQPGDEVFGDISESGWGGLAEFASVKEKALVSKPHQITHIQAASFPQAGVLALQALNYKRPVKPGDTILINGAGGGVGTFAVQLAKVFGAEVTGVDHPDKFNVMRNAGADSVIDYTNDPLTVETFDRIISVAGNRSVRSFRKMLKKKGVFVMIGGTMKRLFQTLFAGPVISMGNKTMGVLFWRPRIADQVRIKEYVQSGRITPVIDRTYPLNEVTQALTHIGEGKAQGKVVVVIRP